MHDGESRETRTARQSELSAFPPAAFGNISENGILILAEMD